MWHCAGGRNDFQPALGVVDDSHTKSVSSVSEDSGEETVSICYKGMNQAREVCSENATRSIFGWLRGDGHAQHEAHIFKHEWFDVDDSEDEEVSEDENASVGPRRSSNGVRSWLTNVPPGLEESDQVDLIASEARYSSSP